MTSAWPPIPTIWTPFWRSAHATDRERMCRGVQAALGSPHDVDTWEKAVTALKWAVREMENRYRNMAKMGVRNITGYNERLADARVKGEVLTRRVQTGFDPETGKPVHEEEVLDLAPLPFIVVIIDEVADLMLVAGKEIEAAMKNLKQ